MDLVRFDYAGRIVVGSLEAAEGLANPDSVEDAGLEIIAFVDANPGIQLLLNLENAPRVIDGAGLELQQIAVAVRADGGRLRVCGAREHIANSLRAGGLDASVVVEPDGPAAAAARFERAIAVDAEDKAWPER